MAGKSKSKVEMIPPDSYPQPVTRAQAVEMVHALRGPGLSQALGRVIENSGEMLRQAIHTYVEELEAAAGDFTLTFKKAHDIRGFAETAGMLSTGRIADGLCRYFEDAGQAGLKPDAEVVALQVSAIGRSARDSDAGSHMSDVVARQLAVLAARKLADARKIIKR